MKITIQKITHSSIQHVRIEQNIIQDKAIYINEMRVNLIVMTRSVQYVLAVICRSLPFPVHIKELPSHEKHLLSEAPVDQLTNVCVRGLEILLNFTQSLFVGFTQRQVCYFRYRHIANSHQTGWCSNDASGFYSGGPQFESQPAYWLS
jgi:hypothetical protein